MAVKLTNREIKHICDWLHGIEFLRNVSLDLRVDMAAVLELRKVSGGKPVFKEGDNPDGFYVVFKGSAKVSSESGVNFVLRTGDYFGEVALFSNARRTATVMAQEASIFVRIKTLDFLKMMTSQNETETLHKVQLLRSMPVFADCTDEQIHNTSMFMFGRIYDENAVVAREGDECDSLYFLASGEIELRQDFEVVRLLHARRGAPVFTSEARSIGVYTVLPGNIFGETSLAVND